jgi:hypothetical protein
MPVMLPHPEEFRALDWRTRDKAITTARALLRAYGGTVSEDMTTDGYRPSRECRARRDAQWAEDVRAQARALEAGA